MSALDEKTAPTTDKPQTPTPEPKVKKFNNGWTSELENLVSDWADRAQCYRWLHDKTSRMFASYNQYMMIPVIVLSTLTGTANFGLDSLFNDANSKRIASLGIGGVSILTGILSTVANFLRYGQGSESHLISSIAWAKFGRFLSIELALNPNERMESLAFLKMFRIELDRLIEQSPTIPESVIRSFKQEFRMLADVKRPEVTGAIEHTRVFDNKNQRLKAVAAEAALMLLHKKQFVKEIAMEDLDKRVRAIIEASINSNTTNFAANPLKPLVDLRKAGKNGWLGHSGQLGQTDKKNTFSDPDEITLAIGSQDTPTHNNQYDKT